MILLTPEVIKRRKMYNFLGYSFYPFSSQYYFNNQHADLKENCHGHRKHHLAEDICSWGNEHCNNQDYDINVLTVGHKSIVFYKSISNKDGENYWKLEYQSENCCCCCYKRDEIENRISCSYT